MNPTGGRKPTFQTKRLRVLIGALALVALALPAISVAGQNTTELQAKLKGKNEVPGPGSQQGKGEIHVFVKPTQGKLCFNFEVSNLDPLIEGHIHKGGPQDSGPVKVTLFQDTSGLDGDGSYEGCVKNLKKKLLRKIAATPEKFYANIHTKDYPDGAVRGQLALSGP